MRPEFNRSLKHVVKPEGFEFDGKRRFTKISPGGVELVIEYLVGVRLTQGRFTVNLIVGDRVVRMATIKPTFVSKLANRLFGDCDPWWKDIFLLKDKWWEISLFQKEMDSIAGKTVTELQAYGIAYLEGMEEILDGK